MIGFCRRPAADLPPAAAYPCPPTFLLTFCPQELEIEEREDTHREVSALLRGVLQRCAAADREFRELGSAPPPPDSDPNTEASTSSTAAPPATSDVSDPLWQILGLANMAFSTEDATSMPVPVIDTAQQQQPQSQSPRQEQQVGSSPDADASAAGPADTQPVVVTLWDAAAHVGAASVAALQLLQPSVWWGQESAPSPPPGVERVTLSDLLDVLGDTAPARAVAGQQRRLQRRILAAADGAGERLRHAGLPWPQLRLSRRSALRCSLEWQGVRWPHRHAASAASLERDLSHC